MTMILKKFSVSVFIILLFSIMQSCKDYKRREPIEKQITGKINCNNTNTSDTVIVYLFEKYTEAYSGYEKYVDSAIVLCGENYHFTHKMGFYNCETCNKWRTEAFPSDYHYKIVVVNGENKYESNMFKTTQYNAADTIKINMDIY